jgi:hypothetical protein
LNGGEESESAPTPRFDSGLLGVCRRDELRGRNESWRGSCDPVIRLDGLSKAGLSVKDAGAVLRRGSGGEGFCGTQKEDSKKEC